MNSETPDQHRCVTTVSQIVPNSIKNYYLGQYVGAVTHRILQSDAATPIWGGLKRANASDEDILHFLEIAEYSSGNWQRWIGRDSARRIELKNFRKSAERFAKVTQKFQKKFDEDFLGNVHLLGKMTTDPKLFRNDKKARSGRITLINANRELFRGAPSLERCLKQISEWAKAEISSSNSFANDLISKALTKRLNKKTAERDFMVRVLSEFFRSRFKNPHHGIVADAVNIAQNLSGVDALDEEKVRTISNKRGDRAKK